MLRDAYFSLSLWEGWGERVSSLTAGPAPLPCPAEREKGPMHTVTTGEKR